MPEGFHAKVVVDRSLVERRLNLITGEETITEVEPRGFLVDEISLAPVRNRRYVSGHLEVTTDQAGKVRQNRRRRRVRRHPFLRRGETTRR